MSYQFLEHTADVAVEIEAESREGLFEEALVAFTAAMTEPDQVQAAERRQFRLEGEDPELMLVDWLSELLYAFEVNGLLFVRGHVKLKEEGQKLLLEAEASGEAYDPERHPIKVLIKGITYHGLELSHKGSGWRARIIFDI